MADDPHNDRERPPAESLEFVGVPTNSGTAGDPLLEHYDTSLRRIGALPELPMRRSAVGEALADLDDDEAVWWIDQLVRGALWGRSPEIDAMLACSDWLIRLRLDDDYGRIQRFYEAATHGDRESVLMLLRDPPPHRELRKGARLPEVRLPSDREITVGERRSMARGPDKVMLQRLLLDPSELVVEKLLENPRVTVDDALVVATRRPTLPGLLEVVVLQPRWFRELRVREAIAQNPFVSTGMALKILPTLNIQTLRRIRNAGDLHPAVHRTAQMLVELREERTAPWRV